MHEDCISDLALTFGLNSPLSCGFSAHAVCSLYVSHCGLHPLSDRWLWRLVLGLLCAHVCVRPMTDPFVHSFAPPGTRQTAGTRRIQEPARPEDLREIERQNTITAQILENFLERRLFPNKRPTHRLPTLDEILPQITTTTAKPTPPTWLQHHRSRVQRNSTRPANSFDAVDVGDDVDETYEDEEETEGGGLGSAEEDYNYRDPESLQSVESEHVDQYLESYRRRTEGRFY